VCPRCLPTLLTSVSAMRITRRCRRCAARAVVAVDARADTDANCASHRVLQHVDNSLAVDKCDARGRRRCCWRSLASRSIRLAAPSRASPCRRIPRRVSPKLGSDPHARRWARAAIAASAVRTYSMIDSVDDAGSGAPSSAGRRLMHALASLASTSLCTAMCASDTAGRRRCASSTRARWSIRSLICSPRTAPELEKERDARVAGALHTLTLLAGIAGHHAAHATPAAADDGLHARRQV
jgi:hypothetical protein